MRRRTRLARLSERESNLDLTVMQFGDRRGRHQRAAADDARLPVGKPLGLVIALDVAPIGPDKVTEPPVERRDADLVHQLHSETRGLELVRMQHLHEAIAVLRVLQIGELVLQRWSDPLNGVVTYFCGIGTWLSHARAATFGASPEINGLRRSAAGTLAASDEPRSFTFSRRP